MVSCAGLGGAWERLSCEVNPAATSSSVELLNKWHRHTEFRSCSCVAWEPLRDVRKFVRMSQGRPHVGWGGVGSQGGVNRVSQVDGDSDEVPA